MWQISGSCYAPGVPTKVDTNICYKDYPSIIKNARLNGFDSFIEEDTNNLLIAQIDALKKERDELKVTVKQLEEKIESVKTILS